MPSDTPAMQNAKRLIAGSWYSTEELTPLPGLGPPVISLTATERYSGTNTSSTATSLLPVPARPITCQVSMIVKSLAGSTKMRGSFVPASWSWTIAPMRLQLAASTPLENGQRPVRR